MNPIFLDANETLSQLSYRPIILCFADGISPALGINFGGASRARTDGLFHAMKAISQLIYSPKLVFTSLKYSISRAASSNKSDILSGFPSCTLFRVDICRLISARFLNRSTISFILIKLVRSAGQNSPRIFLSHTSQTWRTRWDSNPRLQRLQLCPFSHLGTRPNSLRLSALRSST